MRFAKVYVEITNVCNRSCDFCPKTMRPARFMPPEDFLIVVKALRPYTEFLYFHLMGEPLLHPQLKLFLQLAAELEFRVIITTNGTLLAKNQQLLLDADALHKVNISLHSFEANEAHDFAEYMDGCCNFAQAAARQEKLVNLRLWNLDAAQKKGKNAENDRILSRLAQTFPAPWAQVRGGLRLAECVYLSEEEIFLWPSLQADDYGEDRFCYGLKDQLGVLSDGTVVPCCLDHEGDIALGNLLQEPLETILQKPRTQAIIDGFGRRCAVEPLCRRCGYSTRFRSGR